MATQRFFCELATILVVEWFLTRTFVGISMQYNFRNDLLKKGVK